MLRSFHQLPAPKYFSPMVTLLEFDLLRAYVDENERSRKLLGATRAGAAATACASKGGAAAAAAADALDDAILMCWKTLVRRIVQEVRFMCDCAAENATL